MTSRSIHLLLGLSLSAALLAPGACEAQRRAPGQYRSWIDTTFSFQAGGIVDAEQISGDIVVTTWNRPEVRVRAWSELGDIASTFTSQRVWLRLQTEDRSGGRVRSGESRYELTVPAGTRVKASSVSGDVTVSGTGGEVEAASVSGDVAVSDGSRLVNVSSVSGDVSVTTLQGDLTVKTVSGDLTARDVTGAVRAGSVSGEILLRNMRSRMIEARTTSGDIDFDGALERDGRYEFGAHSGTVRLRLPHDASAELSIETFSGSLNTDFPVTLGPNPLRTRRNMEFTLGTGGARVTAQTFSGDVVLQRAPRAGS